MDDKELESKEEFDLDSILNEYQNTSEQEEDAPDLDALLKNTEIPSPDSEEEIPAAEEEISLSSEETVSDKDSSELTEEEAAYAEQLMAEAQEAADSQEAPSEEVISAEENEGEEASGEEIDSEFSEGALYEEDSSENAPSAEIPEEDAEIPSSAPADPQAKLRELKHRLVSGPEKRYYDLTELGLGKLQLAVLCNIILVILCTVGAVAFAAGKVPASRMRFLVFSQILAMLVSGLLGLNLIIDGLSEPFKGRFSINTMLGVTFIACIADAFFSLRDVRVPCCCAFCLQMVFALSARCQQRGTEMSQMDTLRKASRLHSLKRVPDYYNGQDGFLRGEGELSDFMDNYQKSSTPQKLQSFYAFLSFLLCIGISVLAGVLHGVSLAVQILATSLLMAVPASFFIALTRPASVLEKRLHMVGAVLCGWSGVKGLSGKAAFPIRDADLFPLGSTKLNGIKFYSDRSPDMIVSYTSSLILEAGSGLMPIFEQLMISRGVVANPVHNFRLYEGGGIGGEVCGETVLLGSTDFLQSMDVHIPEGSKVSQAVYAAIDGELCAVVAVSFTKMRSAAAGMVTLCGFRKLTPVFISGDFILSESFVRSKFEINTHRLKFPSAEERTVLLSRQAPAELPGLAISTRTDLISYAYAVTGARSLRVSCKNGMLLHLVGGILGMLIMLVLAITGSAELLKPVNILLYQLIWLIPGFLITEWTRHV